MGPMENAGADRERSMLRYTLALYLQMAHRVRRQFAAMVCPLFDEVELA